MSRKRLHIELDFAFACIGISCHQKDYRLGWNINEALNIRLQKVESIILEDKLFGEEMKFPKFYFQDEVNGAEYTLIGNRNKWGFLIPEEPNMDYFLVINSERFDRKETLQKLRDINIILSFGSLNVEKLKNKERLLL